MPRFERRALVDRFQEMKRKGQPITITINMSWDLKNEVKGDTDECGDPPKTGGGFIFIGWPCGFGLRYFPFFGRVSQAEQSGGLGGEIPGPLARGFADKTEFMVPGLGNIGHCSGCCH